MSAGAAGVLPCVLRAIAGITVATGALTAVRPGLVLGELSPGPTPMDQQLFGTIGMFMVVSGGTLHRALDERRALAVAGFDFASGLCCLAYAAALGNTERRSR